MKGAPIILRGVAQLFHAAIKTRAAGYDAGVFSARKVPGIAVVSVGNLRLGGSGKTPLGMSLAKQVRKAGVPTALIFRGYRGALERSGGCVSMGNGPLIDARAAGDEAYLAALRLNGVQVWIGRNRVTSTRKARAAGARIAILDDGFQHRRLHRDLDILLACPEDLQPATKLLPAGPLRETHLAAARADLVGGLATDWKHQRTKPQLLLQAVPACLVHRTGNHRLAPVPLTQYENARAYLVSGIARPQRFARTVVDAGFTVVGHSVFQDHHRFHRSDEIAIRTKAKAAGAKIILTTEKDLVRMFDLDNDLPLYGLRIDVKPVSGEDALGDAIASLAASYSLTELSAQLYPPPYQVDGRNNDQG